MSHRLATLLTCAALASLVACAPDTNPGMVGTLERDRVELVADSNEPIVTIHVADGQRVAAGDTLWEQDPARATARLQQLQGQREQAAARLAELVRGPREEQIREARAQLQASEAQAANAERNFLRAQDIFDRGLSDAQTLDNARALRDTYTATARASREALARLLNGSTVEELQQAQAVLAAAEGAERQAELDLDRTRARAPVSGIVDKVLYEVGERPPPGATVAVLLDDARVYARIYVPADLRDRAQPGVKLEVRFAGIADAFPGTVTWVSADASFTPYFALTEHDRSRLSYLAEVDLAGADGLPAGLPLQATLPGH